MNKTVDSIPENISTNVSMRPLKKIRRPTMAERKEMREYNRLNQKRVEREETKKVAEAVESAARLVKVGRPSKYSMDKAKEICSYLVMGYSLRKVCVTMRISPNVIYCWLEAHKEFKELYAQARADAADAMVEEMLDIADESVIQGDASDSARVQQNRLRVETRKWIASKLRPKKYGEKLDLTSDGQKLPVPILAVVREGIGRVIEPSGSQSLLSASQSATSDASVSESASA